MEIIITNLEEALENRTYQEAFPVTMKCHKCQNEAYPILIVDDEYGELVELSPDRDEQGIPIWPHDSSAYILYMCSKCGEVIVNWNQA